MTTDADDQTPSAVGTVVAGKAKATGSPVNTTVNATATIAPGEAHARGGSATITVGDFRDWLPPGSPEPNLAELITREEMLDQVRAIPMRISESTLRNREAQGILPRPMRRWRGGSTKALYPTWMPRLVAFTDLMLDSRSGRLTVPDPSEVAAQARDYVLDIYARIPMWESKEFNEDLPRVLATVADVFQQVDGRRPVTATVTLKGEDGTVLAILDRIEIEADRAAT